MSHDTEHWAATGTPHGAAEDPQWSRLSPRLLLVNLSMLAGPLALFAVTVALTGANLQALISLGSLLIVFLVITGISTMRLLTTRYRVTADRVELRSGLLFRSRRSVPVDRVRNVDVEAKPMHRLFGLTSLRIGTGDNSASSRKLALDGITRRQARQLRRLLIDLRGSGRATGQDEDVTIAEMDWAWLRYAPLTIWGVGSVLAGVGTAYRILHEMKVDPLELGIVKDIEDRFGSVPLWFGILVAVVITAAVGAAVSTVTFVDAWTNYRLERERDGFFRIRRGLLISRSVTIEERRLRGVEIAEPMLLRWAGGAALSAIASGLSSTDQNRNRASLTPPVPRDEALRVAADVLAEEGSPTELTKLVRHSRAALRRRINRGLLVLAAVVAVPLGLGLWLTPVLVHTAWITALVGLPVVFVLANDAYRALGHGIRDRYLVVRAGTFTRRTVALQRDGVIGWNISRSYFQRRNGLLTIGATTAGVGCYKVRDVSVGAGLAYADEAVPRLLAPFIERVPRG
ncbi:PH domain-containing protein [Streptomyces sp. NBC_00536]|uniref:PH domain-containing protein n=1 Tax=Streptomyces sp. NBC_00536 TaxID=2975769 RepID=UPI002E8051A8|nr:PH domain-containing protein [Streptomyces sp. NBC_00536]WUC81702.1 PH domain-containing protein [Streptomyces sp. NBC_00536]